MQYVRTGRGSDDSAPAPPLAATPATATATFVGCLVKGMVDGSSYHCLPSALLRLVKERNERDYQASLWDDLLKAVTVNFIDLRQDMV